jgi:hypothetical protein
VNTGHTNLPQVDRRTCTFFVDLTDGDAFLEPPDGYMCDKDAEFSVLMSLNPSSWGDYCGEHWKEAFLNDSEAIKVIT